MVWCKPVIRNVTAGRWDIPRKSTILTNCSPESFVSASKFFEYRCSYQAAISAGVLTFSGIMDGLVSNTPLITHSTKRISVAAMCRASSIALLDAESGLYSVLLAGTASRIFFVVRLSVFKVPRYTFCSRNTAWSDVIASAISLLLNALRLLQVRGGHGAYPEPHCQ